MDICNLALTLSLVVNLREPFGFSDLLREKQSWDSSFPEWMDGALTCEHILFSWQEIN
jgi:hypothetical protein